ncbi:MAG TPA: AAA family ATPase [Candidatus Dormibacteraeota bacterium]|nr:AAA family ATPase [Candidatus Dormibacteraeota bacterium]
MADAAPVPTAEERRLISSVEVLGYRCLEYVQVRLRPLAILVGPNGSGKSSFLDALHFVRDLLRDGPAEAVAARADELEDLTWMRRGSHFEIALEVELPERLARGARSSCRYAVRIGRTGEGEVGVLEEYLWLKPAAKPPPAQASLFPHDPTAPATLVREPPRGSAWRVVVRKVPGSGNDYFRSEAGDWNIQFRVGPRRAALASLPDDESRFPAAAWLRRFLSDGLLWLQLNSRAMRQPVSPRDPKRFLPDGSNLPLVVEDLKAGQPDRFEEWLRHLRFVLPGLDDIEIETRESDRYRYLVLEYDSGLRAPSWLVSDGTLRILALTLLAYLPTTEGALYLIEEPENGLHPKALEPVFQSLASVYEGQVLVATHSALLLGLAEPSQILCFATTRRGAADVVSGDQHPALQLWRGEVDLGTLLASGVPG